MAQIDSSSPASLGKHDRELDERGGGQGESKKSSGSAQVHGEAFEASVRSGLAEALAIREFGEVVQRCEVRDEEGRILGDIDAYVVLNEPAYVRELLPSFHVINSGGLQDLELHAGSGIIFEASTSWDKKRDKLVTKDNCFSYFSRQRSNRWIVVFIFNGEDPTSNLWPKDEHGEEKRFSFLTKRTTMFVWCQDSAVHSWSKDLKMIQLERKLQIEKTARAEAEAARAGAEAARAEAEKETERKLQIEKTARAEAEAARAEAEAARAEAEKETERLKVLLAQTQTEKQ